MDTSTLFPFLAMLISAIASLVKLMWAQFKLANPTDTTPESIKP